MSAQEVLRKEDLVNTAIKAFEDYFHSTPTHCGCAPGRVNLIGEHTDYNDGFVLPMALPMVTVILGRKTNKEKCCVLTLNSQVDEPKVTEFHLPTATNPLTPGKPSWANYVKGIVANFKGTLHPFDAVIATSIPVGGGLSSSAALEVATYIFLEALTGETSGVSVKDKALACQKAEHEFPKMPCGIMDQFIAFMGKRNHALFIDCRSLESKLILLKDQSMVVLITNSNVRHELTGTEYSTRRKQCEVAAQIMGKDSLRDAKLTDLEEFKNKLTGEVYRRGKHAISEIHRTEKAAKALENGDYIAFGKLMFESHKSLRDDYEVSCTEIDKLVDAAMQVEGVYGSRITGGGFGGCTVTMLKVNAVKKAIKYMKEKCSGSLDFYVCQPEDGAHELILSL